MFDQFSTVIIDELNIFGPSQTANKETMSLSKEDVEKIAELARLALEPQEVALYQEQLSAVLAYAERLSQLDTTDVSPTASAVALTNVMREDVIQPSLPIDEVLFNSADQIDSQFKIQAVLNEE